MGNTLLRVGKAITFCGIALYVITIVYILRLGERTTHSTDSSTIIIWSDSFPAWVVLAPFVVLSIGAVLWSIGKRAKPKA